jgi:polyhydroxyalkanoate synthesis regulator phasin
MSPSEELKIMPESRKFALTVLASCAASLLAAGAFFFLALPTTLTELKLGQQAQTDATRELKTEVQKVVGLDLVTGRLVTDMAQREMEIGRLRETLSGLEQKMAAMTANRFTSDDGHALAEKFSGQLATVREKLNALARRQPVADMEIEHLKDRVEALEEAAKQS